MDQLTKDLSRKAGDDAAGAITRTMALMDDPLGKAAIALNAAVNAAGLAAGMLAIVAEGRGDRRPAEEIAATFWRIASPSVLDAIAIAAKSREAAHG